MLPPGSLRPLRTVRAGFSGNGRPYGVLVDFGAIIYQGTPNLNASDNLCTRTGDSKVINFTASFFGSTEP